MSGSIGLEKHFRITESLSPYAGVIGTVNWSQTTYKYVYTDSTRQMITSSRGFGGSIMVGAEYWITPRISLAGEKTFGVSYTTASSGSNASSTFAVFISTSSLMLLIYL